MGASAKRAIIKTLEETKQELDAQKKTLLRRLTESIERGEPFGYPNHSLFITIVSLESAVRELQYSIRQIEV